VNPYLSLEGFAGISFFAFCAAFVLFHMQKTRDFQPVDFTIMSMGLVYGALFPIVVHGADSVRYPGSDFIQASSGFILAHTASAIIAVIGVFLGWCAMSQRRRDRLGLFFSESRPKRIIFWLYVMTITAFVTQYLYTRDYGGFIGYFAFNRLVRSGLFDQFDRSQFSFLAPFGGMTVIACYGFWGMILSRYRGVLIWVGFLMSLSFSCYYLLASAGRVSMVIFLAILLMSFMLVRRTNYMIWFLSIPLAAPAALFAIFLISNLLNLKAADDITYFIAKESSFPFTAFFAQLNEGYLFFMFYELIFSPAYLLPSSLTGSWFPSATDFNTEIIWGVRKEVGGTTSGMPTDMLTFGLMQFHVLGVFIYAFAFGYLLRVFTSIAGSFPLMGMSSVFVSYVVIKIGIFAVFYSQTQHIVRGNFAAIAVILAAIGLRAIRRLLSRHHAPRYR